MVWLIGRRWCSSLVEGWKRNLRPSSRKLVIMTKTKHKHEKYKILHPAFGSLLYPARYESFEEKKLCHHGANWLDFFAILPNSFPAANIFGIVWSNALKETFKKIKTLLDPKISGLLITNAILKRTLQYFLYVVLHVLYACTYAQYAVYSMCCLVTKT